MRFLTIFGVLFIYFCTLSAQYDSLFVHALVVTPSDTLYGFIECNPNFMKKIKLYEEPFSKNIVKIKPDTIKKLYTGSCEYAQIHCDNELLIAKVEVSGLVNLYSDPKNNSYTSGFSYNSYYDGSFLENVDLYIQFDGTTYRLDKQNYLQILSIALRNDPDLVSKIQSMNYSKVIRRIIGYLNTYNAQFDNLVPLVTPKLQAIIQEKHQERHHRIGIYMPFAFSYNFLSVSEHASQEFFYSYSTKPTYRIGLGLSYDISQRARVSMGVNYYTTGVYMEYNTFNNDMPGNEWVVRENTSINFFTANPNIEFNFNQIYTGIGVNFSFFSSFKSHKNLYDYNGEKVDLGTDKTIVRHNTNSIVNIDYFIGKRFVIGGLGVCPNIIVHIPVNNIFNVGNPVPNIPQLNVAQEGIKAYALSIGLKINLNRQF